MLFADLRRRPMKDIHAEVNLGIMNETDQGIKQRDSEGFSWYEKAAILGDVQAQSKLAHMHDNGRG